MEVRKKKKKEKEESEGKQMKRVGKLEREGRRRNS